MKKVVIEYSEDFGENGIAKVVYNRLREDKFDPIHVRHDYAVRLGTSRVEFDFRTNTLPGKSALAERLKDLNIKKLEVIGSHAQPSE